jgi:hypothetical protein
MDSISNTIETAVIQARIDQYTTERDNFARQANEQLAAYNGAINALKMLLAPPVNEAANDVQ